MVTETGLPEILTAISLMSGASPDGIDAVFIVGWDGDALESQAFAHLALRSMAGLSPGFPETTGVARATPGGRLFEKNP